MDSTRQRVLTVARDLFDRHGVAGMSMRRIADAVAITPMAIYRHYADKNALLDALMLDGFTAWERRVAAITAPDPMKWLELFAAAFLDFALSEPRRYEAAFLLPAGRARRYPDDFVAGRSPAINLVYARIAETKAQGMMGDAPATQIALSLAALAQGLVSMYRAGRFVGEAEFRAAYGTALRQCLTSYTKGATP